MKIFKKSFSKTRLKINDGSEKKNKVKNKIDKKFIGIIFLFIIGLLFVSILAAQEEPESSFQLNFTESIHKSI